MAIQRVSEKRKTGRPVTWQTAAQIEKIVDAYIDYCEPHMEKGFHRRKDKDGVWRWVELEEYTSHIPTITDFAWFAGVNKDTITEYSHKDGFSVPIKRLKLYCERYVESLLLDPYNHNVTGAIFNLKNNYGWVDKRENEHTGPAGGPIAFIDMSTDATSSTNNT